MRMDKLTSKFQLALGDAQSLALGNDHQFIEPVHLMLALLDQQGGSAVPLLKQSGANVSVLRAECQASLKRLAQVSGSGGDVQISSELTKLLNLTDKMAQQRKDDYISSELFLLAACASKGSLSDALAKAQVSQKALETAIESARGGQAVTDPNAEDQREALK
ncbi:MAG: type VI secretion system ATPase TssH, partial [Methylococcaceae bacterium]|nr:type VI secretion system ATPase TssH [Methylococcaceae bacterium]